MITGEVRSKVDKLWETFWINGISNPISVIEQISYLLFIKRLDDLELTKEKKAQRLNRPVKDAIFSGKDDPRRWSYFKNLDNPEEKLRVVRDEAFPFIKNLRGEAGNSTYAHHMQNAIFLIANPALLASVIEQIDKMLELLDKQAQASQDQSYVDLMGDLYEYMLSKLTQAQNGQFRTPRHIIKMMVQLMEPGPREIVCDPACGTAGFLVAVAEYLRDLKDNDGNSILSTPEDWWYFNQEMFHGFDFDATMLRIGSMNLMLHGVESPKIEARDSLSEDHAGVDEAFTMILANPPFKGLIAKDTIAKDLTRSVSTTKTELLFGALFLRLLKKGGRGAVIVPDGVLFGSSTAHKALRKELVENHKLDGVISMPSGVFKPYAGVSTAVLIFTKTGAGGTDFVWFYDMQADGLSLDSKRQPVQENDIPDIIKRWQERDVAKDIDRTAKAFFVPKDEIRANDYDLSINRYKQEELGAIISNKNFYKTFTSEIVSLRGLSNFNNIEENGSKTLRRLVYVGVITCLETYLSDAFINIVLSHEKYLESFYLSYKEYKETKIELSEVFKYYKEAKEKAKDTMQSIVFHNLPRIRKIYSAVLEVDFPDEEFSKLNQAVSIRHDLVHRNGKNKEDVEINITQDMISDLIQNAESFIEKIDKQIRENIKVK